MGHLFGAGAGMAQSNHSQWQLRAEHMPLGNGCHTLTFRSLRLAPPACQHQSHTPSSRCQVLPRGALLTQHTQNALPCCLCFPVLPPPYRCPFDDILLAVRRARAASGGAVRRVLVVDLDAHQGNGVERVRFRDGRVAHDGWACCRCCTAGGGTVHTRSYAVHMRCCHAACPGCCRVRVKALAAITVIP